MAYDTGMAEQMREDIGDLDGLSEKKMFGGLCFLLHGNMICGVHKGGAMFRVGKSAEAQARALPGVTEMDFTGRPMGGFVNAGDAALADDDIRGQLTRMALDYATALPPK